MEKVQLHELDRVNLALESGSDMKCRATSITTPHDTKRGASSITIAAIRQVLDGCALSGLDSLRSSSARRKSYKIHDAYKSRYNAIQAARVTMDTNKAPREHASV